MRGRCDWRRLKAQRRFEIAEELGAVANPEHLELVQDKRMIEWMTIRAGIREMSERFSTALANSGHKIAMLDPAVVINLGDFDGIPPR